MQCLGPRVLARLCRPCPLLPARPEHTTTSSHPAPTSPVPARAGLLRAGAHCDCCLGRPGLQVVSHRLAGGAAADRHVSAGVGAPGACTCVCVCVGGGPAVPAEPPASTRRPASRLRLALPPHARPPQRPSQRRRGAAAAPAGHRPVHPHRDCGLRGRAGGLWVPHRAPHGLHWRRGRGGGARHSRAAGQRCGGCVAGEGGRVGGTAGEPGSCGGRPARIRGEQPVPPSISACAQRF